MPLASGSSTNYKEMGWNALKVTFNQYVYIEFNNLIFRSATCHITNTMHTHQVCLLFSTSYLASFSRTLNGLAKLLKNKKMFLFCLTISKKCLQTLLTVANKYKIFVELSQIMPCLFSKPSDLSSLSSKI